MSEEDVFFAPRVIHVQPRLEFLTIPPDRIVAFPTEYRDFCGLRLHWCGGTSRLCPGIEKCVICGPGNQARDYFYAGCYLWSAGNRSFSPFVLPIGNDLTGFADHQLHGWAWKLSPRMSTEGKKKGLKISKVDTAPSVIEEINGLKPFDIRSRLLKRFAS